MKILKSLFSIVPSLAGCLMSGGCSGPGMDVRPNVIYVFPDQMRNHAMAFWNEPGYKEHVRFTADPVHTPNLNRFARQSMVLSSAVSNCPVSSPHRGMLLTGMYPDGSGVTLNCNSDRPVSNLRADAVCISDVMKGAGYQCAYIGKLHVDYPTPNDPQCPGRYVESRQPAWDAYTPPGRRHGFDYWYSYGTFDVHKRPHYWDTEGNRYDPGEWSPKHETDKVISYLKNENSIRDAARPFFMMISYNPPHGPYRSLDDCMEEDYALYQDQPPGRLLIRPNADTTMSKAGSAPYYFASVTGVDREFGRILKTLEDLGLDRNTIVVFTSDHGETMCSHSLTDPKNSPYAESLNVPFLIRYPGRITPGVDNLLLSSPDIMPTLLGLCGLAPHIPAGTEGTDYSRLFLGDELLRPQGALYIRNVDGDKNPEGKVLSYIPEARGIKTEKYTMSLTVDPVTKRLKSSLLFDDVNDPYQLVNLPLEDHPDVVQELAGLMASLLRQANDPWYRTGMLKEMIPYEIMDN